jgi:hypothetical protein
VANGIAVQNWNLLVPAGGLVQYTFTFTTLNASGSRYIPYPILGATWEYVARASYSSSAAALITITTSASTAGRITVTATSATSAVTLSIYGVATEHLDTTYYHALWMDPGTSSAFVWFNGNLQVQGTAQP